MKAVNLIKGTALGLACLGMLTPANIFAQSPAAAQVAPQAKISDIALAGGSLKGVVLDPNGDIMSGAVISVSHGNQKVATAISSQEGEFAVPGLQSGLYQVSVGQNQASVRVWDAELAPPGTNSEMVLVNGQPTARAQFGSFSNRTLIIGTALVATAIAVPVAIHNNRSPKS